MGVEDEFFTILTKVGQAKIAAAVANSDTIKLHSLAVGDGGGSVYVPDDTQTALRHELWRGELNELRVDVANPNWITVTAVLPADVGGWYVREGALFDTDGDLIAIAKLPVTYKPLLEMGSSKQLYIQIIMEVTNASVVTLLVDGSVVLATREYVDNRINNISFNTMKDVPVATLQQKGITQLNNATDSNSENQAATPKAVKTAMDNANSRAPASHNHKWNNISEVPDATLTQKGIVKLNSSTNSAITTEAATPSAVKAAMDNANSRAPASHNHKWAEISEIPDATLTQKGIVKLNSSTNSNITTEAATPSAVKAAMDSANSALEKANSAISQASGAINQATADARYLTSMRVFESNGVFTVPAGVTSVYVEMIGGGGGGGGGGGSQTGDTLSASGAGGKRGAPVFMTTPVIPGTNMQVIVGGGGGAGLATHNTGSYIGGYDATSGGQGGDSSFNGIVATGGTGGLSLQTERSNGEDSTHGYGGSTSYTYSVKSNLQVSTNSSEELPIIIPHDDGEAAFEPTRIYTADNGSGRGAGGCGGGAYHTFKNIFPGGRGSDGIVIISW
ncbi:tail fiber protein [Obesumbacterium proteus]|uniref:tail fiber protein n=1 Tax=Obesumbacterium proteus TaxID=82983 RepID=UPI0006993AB0